tara:strand:+ start:3077 stop:3808 length:732 start_codon:yes stop_codon:yes gene_type:complete
MLRILAVLYGVLNYFIFLGTYIYTVGFVGNLVIPKSIDAVATVPFNQALITNIMLLSIFAIQQRVMVHPAFKNWWIHAIPQVIERSTYVLLSSLALIIIYWQWQPMNGVIWDVSNPIASSILWVLFILGWLIVVFSTFLLNHFDLFGLRQVYLYMKGKELIYIDFNMPLIYKIVRHPIMLGCIIAFWSTPYMSTSHLLFALAATVYILITIQLEEHDFNMIYGDEEQEYRQSLSLTWPFTLEK